MNVAHLARVLASERCSVHEIALALGRSEAFIAKSIRYTPKPDRHGPERSKAGRRSKPRVQPSSDLLELLNGADTVPESIGKVPTFSRLDNGTMGSWFPHPASIERSASSP